MSLTFRNHLFNANPAFTNCPQSIVVRRYASDYLWICGTLTAADVNHLDTQNHGDLTPAMSSCIHSVRHSYKVVLNTSELTVDPVRPRDVQCGRLPGLIGT
jgi:hypothetical protein